MAKKLTKHINSQFIPTFIEGYPMYAAGGAIDPMSILLQQGQQMLSDVGTGMDSYITNQRPEKANLGSAFFSNYLSGGMGIQGAIKGVGAMLNRKREFEDQQAQEKQLQQEMLKKQTINNLPAQHDYIPTFADGGSIYIKPSKRGTFKAQASKMGMSVQEAASKILNAPEGRYSPAMRKKANFAKNFAKADGGQLEFMEPISPVLNSYTPELIDTRNRIYSKEDTFNNDTTYFDEAQRLDAELQRLKAIQNPTNKDLYNINKTPKLKNDLYLDQVGGYAMGGKLDNITDRLSEIKNGGTHEQSPTNGVPIQNNALVEEGEFIYTGKNGKKYVFTDRF